LDALDPAACAAVSPWPGGPPEPGWPPQGRTQRRLDRVNAEAPLRGISCISGHCRMDTGRFYRASWLDDTRFDRLYSFHALRHTAVTNVYRASRDLFLAQRFARHVSPLTTTVYTHPSDNDMQRILRKLGC